MKRLEFYAADDRGRRFAAEQTYTDGILTVTLSKRHFENATSLCVECDAFCATAGERGYYLIPESTNTKGSALTRFTEREDCEFESKVVTTLFLAVGLEDATYVVIPECYYSYSFRGECRKCRYRVLMGVDFTVQPAADDIVLRVLTLPEGSDYNAVARAVREYRLGRGEIAPLTEKVRSREVLEYYRKYPLIRIRMGWKPAPPTVLHQTEENEPPMHVACTFARVRDIADELKRQGVDGATLCLVGWNQKGHDGRWPQMFPVEESLGGETELKRTVEYVRSLGYAITCHTNCLDHYEVADIFDPSILVRRRDGEPYQKGKWSGGEAYRACPVHQLELSKSILPKVCALGFEGVHYVDVLSIIMPDACFSEAHPCSTREGIEYMKEIMRLSHSLFGGFSSEGGMDFALGELDFSLYNRFPSFSATPPTETFVDAYIPLWELTYHGITLYNSCAETVNYTVKGRDAEVTAALLGGMPAFYFYSKFRSAGSSNWMGEIDLLCDDDEQLAGSVSAIKRAYERYFHCADRQLVYMRSYEVSDNGLAVVTYEDGSVSVGNYTDGTLEYKGRYIPAHTCVEL